MGEEVGGRDNERVIAIASSLVRGVVYVAEMVVLPSYFCERLVDEVEGISDGVLGDVCNGVMGFGGHQHKSVLLVDGDDSAELALSRDKWIWECVMGGEVGFGCAGVRVGGQ